MSLSLKAKAKRMILAIHAAEGALCDPGMWALTDLPSQWGDDGKPSDNVVFRPKLRADAIWRLRRAFDELNAIVNDDEFNLNGFR